MLACSAIAKAVPVEVRPKHPLYQLSGVFRGNSFVASVSYNSADEVLDEAADRAMSAGHNPKVLLLTNPQNPLVSYNIGEYCCRY